MTWLPQRSLIRTQSASWEEQQQRLRHTGNWRAEMFGTRSQLRLLRAVPKDAEGRQSPQQPRARLIYRSTQMAGPPSMMPRTLRPPPPYGRWLQRRRWRASFHRASSVCGPSWSQQVVPLPSQPSRIRKSSALHFCARLRRRQCRSTGLQSWRRRERGDLGTPLPLLQRLCTRRAAAGIGTVLQMLKSAGSCSTNWKLFDRPPLVRSG
mmetsp:Transcript_14062/g.42451  ORF Transcript_14062/g.42451 Transcript_14062/m.42451 type:complete len:208 (+) Transcript_14062:96-719(+)